MRPCFLYYFRMQSLVSVWLVVVVRAMSISAEARQLSHTSSRNSPCVLSMWQVVVAARVLFVPGLRDSREPNRGVWA